MGLRDKTTPTLTTPLIRSNMSCAGSYHLSSLAFLSSSISMANLSRSGDASFSSLALLSSSVSMANLSCLLATTFCSLRFLSNLLSSPRFNLLRVASRCFLLFLFSLFSVAETLYTLSFPFLSERFFFIYAKAALVCIVEFINTGVTGHFLVPKNDSKPFFLSRNELARPVMGTIFLVGRAKQQAPHWGVQSRFRMIYA